MSFVEIIGGAASFGVDPARVDAVGVNPAGGAWVLHSSLPRRWRTRPWRTNILMGDLVPLLRIVWGWAFGAIPCDPVLRRRPTLQSLICKFNPANTGR
jgi:hypothetical protein